jgi:type III restriction enzyme
MHIPTLVLDRTEYPNQVDLGPLVLDASGQLVPTMSGHRATLEKFREGKRIQGLAFDLARALTEQLADRTGIAVPKHALFPQLLRAAERYIKEKVKAPPGSEKIDVYIPTYFARAFHALRDHIRPDQSEGEAPEIPVYEGSRDPGSTADVDLWTRRPTVVTKRSHVNYVIADSTWEAAAVPTIDDHALVESFVKNAGLGFTVPYQLMAEDHEYTPDFIIRLKGEPLRHLILEIKGHDDVQEYKVAAAARWVEAVNAEGSWGRWYYGLVKDVNAIDAVIRAAHAAGSTGASTFVLSEVAA